jgi:hypothetical protein
MDLVSSAFTLPVTDYDNSSTTYDSATIIRFDNRDNMENFIIAEPNVTQAGMFSMSLNSC